MLPLAEILTRRGYRIYAYDRLAENAHALSSGENQSVDAIGYSLPRGMIFCPHYEVDWRTVSLAVYSLAIDESDPEILAAKSHGIPLISRAQLLCALMSEAKTRISVSGSHGKSTTTAIIDHILTYLGNSPTTVSGARLSSGRAYSVGSGEIFIAEACEYKDSFLRLCPTHQLITSVELDHTDYFTSTEHIRRSFLTAAKCAETVIINRDDRVASSIADELKSECRSELPRVITYGESPLADYRLCVHNREGGITRFSIISRGRTIELETKLIGKFNLYNITAAVTLCDTIGTDQMTVIEAIRTFSSIDRRMTHITDIGGVPVYYDYAHHPTEIAAVITALKELHGSITVIFCPHTFSRTRSLWNDFVAALSKADFTILLDIYPARENPINGVDSKILAKAIPGAVHVSSSDATKIALSHPTGAIALVGAGDVEYVRSEFILLGQKEKEN